MNDTDTTRAASLLEADTLQRSGQFTLTQAKAHVRDRRASPVAHLALQQTDALNRALAVLRELHSTCLLLDHQDQMQRPTEAEYQEAMSAAARELGRH